MSDVKLIAHPYVLAISALTIPECQNKGEPPMVAECGVGWYCLLRKGQLHEDAKAHILHHGREGLIIQDNHVTNSSGGPGCCWLISSSSQCHIIPNHFLHSGHPLHCLFLSLLPTFWGMRLNWYTELFWHQYRETNPLQPIFPACAYSNTDLWVFML